MICKGNNSIVASYLDGIAKKSSNTISTGAELYLFGNKIAEHRDGFIWICNGGYEGRRGETGSATTKARLNDIGVRIYQAKKKWFLNGLAAHNFYYPT